MGASHYTATELAELMRREAFEYRVADHVRACEACDFLLALVRRARGEPSDEQMEVTVDVLRSWSVSR